MDYKKEIKELLDKIGDDETRKLEMILGFVRAAANDEKR